MRIPLNRQGDEPLYRQIAEHLRHGIISGSLAPDMRLPASRQLARDLGVSRITVENAYAELEADGLVSSRVGSGTYVLPPGPLPDRVREEVGTAWPLWQLTRDQGGACRRKTPDEMLKEAGHPDPISFASGSGDPSLFPVEDWRKAVQTVIRRDGTTAMEYGEAGGYAPLRAAVARVLGSQGLGVRAENILITSGSQQAMALVAQLLLRPGDVVLTESPTYGGALDLFQALGLEVRGIPADEGGMVVENLEEMLQKYHPKLIYTIPNFQNPTGTCLGGQRRRHLVNLADRYNVPILEDDYVGDLRYQGHAHPPLKALDPGGRVIYVSTFSKMLLPGIRIGFAVAEGPVFAELVNRKRVHDLASSHLMQQALEAYVTVGRYQAHLNHSRQVYRQRRDAMQQAVRHCLPPEVALSTPQGGLFLWVRLPADMSAEKLLPLACEEGVAFAPGRDFYPGGDGGEDCLRLNFAVQTPERIEEGIMRLGRAIKRFSAV